MENRRVLLFGTYDSERCDDVSLYIPLFFPALEIVSSFLQFYFHFLDTTLKWIAYFLVFPYYHVNTGDLVSSFEKRILCA